MAFIDEVEDFEKKAHLRHVAPVAVVGIVAVVLAIVFFLLQGAFAGGNDFTLEQGAEGAAGSSIAETGSDATGVTESGGSTSTGSSAVCVYVTGAVKRPGIYSFDDGARVADAIKKAGGFTAKAASSSLNLARKLEDGEQIEVLTRSQAKRAAATTGQTASAGGTGGVGGRAGTGKGRTGDAAGGGSSGKVNINTASLEELETLNGIGAVTAQKIIDYRTSSGPFATPEDLKNVSGIGDKRFAAIADAICV